MITETFTYPFEMFLYFVFCGLSVAMFLYFGIVLLASVRVIEFITGLFRV